MLKWPEFQRSFGRYLTDETHMYLATVIDYYSRGLVGFAIADHMRTSLVQDALKMAKGQRGSLKDAIF